MTTDDLQPVAAHCAPGNHYPWGDGCDGWVLEGGPGLLVIEERMPAGASEAWHVHDVARQFFYLLTGRATLHTPSGPVELSERSGVAVPAGLAHRIVAGADVDTTFLVVSAPSTVGDRRDVPAPTD